MTEGAVMADETRRLLETTLRRLLSEIAAGDYRDSLKRRLTKHTAYTDALAVLALSQVLDADPS